MFDENCVKFYISVWGQLTPFYAVFQSYEWASSWLSGRVCLPVQEMQECQVLSLGQEDPLEKEVATHSYSYLENSMDRGPWRVAKGP